MPGNSPESGFVAAGAASRPVTSASVAASSPAQKPRPAPVMTMPTTRWSTTHASTARRISPSVWYVKALSLSGRFRRITATGSSISRSMSE
jgi:hypothetical protein